MAEPQRVLLLGELLRQRSAYCNHFNRRSTPESALNDVDFILCWFLIERLSIRCVIVDDEAVAEFLQEQKRAEPSSNAELIVLTSAGSNLEQKASTWIDRASGALGDEAPTVLHLFGAAREISRPWLGAAARPNAIAFCYGCNAELGETFPPIVAALSAVEEPPAFVPTAGLGPALWRGGTLLVARQRHRAALQGAVRQFADLFNTQDLDALGLLEEKTSLCERIAQLCEPGTAQAELEQLSGKIKALQTDLASLRRTATAQEQAIVELQGQLRQARQRGATMPAEAAGNGSPKPGARLP